MAELVGFDLLLLGLFDNVLLWIESFLVALTPEESLDSCDGGDGLTSSGVLMMRASL